METVAAVSVLCVPVVFVPTIILLIRLLPFIVKVPVAVRFPARE